MPSTTRTKQRHEGITRTRVLVVGAGFAGLGAAIRLLDAGYHDFVVVERADAVGGTWRDNSYPGCAVDVPSTYYQLSFAPKHDWSRAFADQSELFEYLTELADRPGVRERIRLQCEMTAAQWDDDERRWIVETSQGVFSAQVLVPAVGILNQISTPELPGLETFQGTVFHTARWNHEHDLTGERVAVIGTGSTASQVVPTIAPDVAQLHVFQRSAGWVMPRVDWKVSRVEKRLMAALPWLTTVRRARQRWQRELMFPAFLKTGATNVAVQRVCSALLRLQVRDPEVRDKLTPRDRFGCKRPILSSAYLPAFNRDNVELVTDPIAEVREHSIVTADGEERFIDSLVLATGFKPFEWTEASRVTGLRGRRLDHDWKERGARAYLGGAVADFPNLFYVVGPNAATFSSIVFVIEAYIEHMIQALRALDEHDLDVLEVRPVAQEAFGEEMDRRFATTVWASGCASWLLHASQHNQTLWPSNTVEIKARLRHFDLSAYTGRPAVRARPPMAGPGPSVSTQLLGPTYESMDVHSAVSVA